MKDFEYSRGTCGSSDEKKKKMKKRMRRETIWEEKRGEEKLRSFATTFCFPPPYHKLQLKFD